MINPGIPNGRPLLKVSTMTAKKRRWWGWRWLEAGGRSRKYKRTFDPSKKRRLHTNKGEQERLRCRRHFYCINRIDAPSGEIANHHSSTTSSHHHQRVDHESSTLRCHLTRSSAAVRMTGKGRALHRRRPPGAPLPAITYLLPSEINGPISC